MEAVICSRVQPFALAFDLLCVKLQYFFRIQLVVWSFGLCPPKPHHSSEHNWQLWVEVPSLRACAVEPFNVEPVVPFLEHIDGCG